MSVMAADPLQITIWPPPPAPRILDIGTVRLDPRWSCALHAPYWRIYHNRSDDGSIIITGPGISLPLPDDRVVAIPPWSALHATCRGHVDHVFLQVDAMLPEWWLRSQPLTIRVLAANPSRHAVFDRLRSTALGVLPASLRLAVVATAAACMAEVLEGLPEAQRASLDDALAAQDALAPALNGITANPAGRLDIDGLAARCGLGRRQFSRLFRERLHASPEQWRQRLRITAAADRLAGGNDTIETIAIDAGFTDRFHFSRVFTRIIGEPPATWRARRQAAKLHHMRISPPAP